MSAAFEKFVVYKVFPDQVFGLAISDNRLLVFRSGVPKQENRQDTKGYKREVHFTTNDLLQEWGISLETLDETVRRYHKYPPSRSASVTDRQMERRRQKEKKLFGDVFHARIVKNPIPARYL